MDILVIGGTMFLGRHFVEAALGAGHTVTLFHRGRTNPDLFPEIEHIHGDRRNPDDLAKLKGRTWDAVVDPSAYFPADVESMAGALRDSVDHYTFVSSISVYADRGDEGADEDSPVIPVTGEMPADKITGENYGAFKAECERIADRIMDGRVLNVRAGLIVGPHDPSDRFTYWPWRVAQGGSVAAPGIPEEPVQFIDVRDLAAWMLAMVEGKRPGTFNATGPEHPLSMRELLETCREVSGSDARFVWLSEELLAAENVAPYTEMPLWIPSSSRGMNRTSIARALAAGLTTRSAAETVADTLAWFGTTDRNGGELRAGLTREREEELLRLASGGEE